MSDPCPTTIPWGCWLCGGLFEIDRVDRNDSDALHWHTLNCPHCDAMLRPQLSGEIAAIRPMARGRTGGIALPMRRSRFGRLPGLAKRLTGR